MQPPNHKKPLRRQKDLPRIAVTWRRRTHSFTIRPWLSASFATVFVLFMACYLSATAYLVYRDDILESALARQVELQYAYEDRIALLRSEIDRVTSRHLVETQSLEEQLEILLEQQDALARRQALLDSLIAKARAEGISPAAAAMPVPVPRPRRSERWTEADGAPQAPLAYAPDRRRRIEAITGTVLQAAASGAVAPTENGDAVRPVLHRLRSSLLDTEERQDQALDVLAAAARLEVSRLSGIMSRLGVRPPQPPQLPEQVGRTGLGGPFIPAESGFLDDALSVSSELLHLAQIRAAAQLLPLGSPVEGSSVTSAFGYRTDPFLKRPAMHGGVDLRAKTGTPVRATGPGKVISAGWNGGYGRMVEIEHAHGLTTRFAHLSKVQVQEGQQVKAGTTIGLAGSTGRSTGAHLHYETRRAGRAVDPMVFLDTHVSF